MRITVLGGTGYTGGHIVKEAAARGHEVRSISRSAPSDPVDGVRYEHGSLLDDTVRRRAVQDTDVVISALSPRDGLERDLRAIDGRLAELAAQAGVRFGVVGGFSALRPEPGAPRFLDAGELPPEFAVEARTMTDVLDDLQTSAPEGLDWFFVSPAQVYGAYAPGEATGRYRLGGEVALRDDEGRSALSGADFALAIVDELEKREHSGHISVAY